MIDALAFRTRAGSLRKHLNDFAKELAVIKKIPSFLLFVIFATGGVCAATPAQPEKPKELSTTMRWTLSLDADGRVASLHIQGESIDALRGKLETAIRRWEFEPGQVDGKPSATDTTLVVELALVPSTDGSEYAARITSARTGGSVADASVAPRFPAASLSNLLNRKDSFNAVVVVRVRYDAAGKVIAIDPEAGTPVQDGPLLASVRKAVKQWTYQPELIAGIGVPGAVLVPVCFTVASDLSTSREKSKRCRWTQPGTEVSVTGGESLAVDSAVSLKTDVSKGVL